MAFISTLSMWLVPMFIGFILLYGTWKKVPTYEAFVEGGKEGIKIAVSLIPFLVGMLVAISIFRASGALEFFMNLIRPLMEWVGIPAEVVPLALIRPISGTAALGITSDLIATYGPDSFIGRLVSVLQGSTDTTFYILTVYFGAVGIKKMGNSLKIGLMADGLAIIASIIIVTLFFGAKA
jgi:spore maturation protein B